MSILPFEVTALLYLAAAVCFILALKGLSSPRTARRGNLIGAAGAVAANLSPHRSEGIDRRPDVAAVAESVDPALADRQSCKHQGTVRNAFVAGNSSGPAKRSARLEGLHGMGF